MENFNKIYTENHKAILNFITMKVKDYTIAEELTNDVFMRVHKHLENFDAEKSSMKTWVINIAKNIVIDHYRKVKLDTVSVDKEDVNGNSGYSTLYFEEYFTFSTPLSQIVTSETVELIENEISSLDEIYKDVATLYFKEELSYDEICDRLNLPLGTVKGQINRARKKLVAKLETLRA